MYETQVVEIVAQSPNLWYVSSGVVSKELNYLLITQGIGELIGQIMGCT